MVGTVNDAIKSQVLYKATINPNYVLGHSIRKS